MEKKKNCGHLRVLRNFLLSFAFCFICTLCFGTVTAHAKTISCNFDNKDYSFILSDSVSANYPYTYIFLKYSGGWQYDVLCSDVRMYTDSECILNGNNTYLFPLVDGDCVFYSVNCSAGDSGVYDLSKSAYVSYKLDNGASKIGGTFKYSNVNVYKAVKGVDNVYTSTSDIFFQYPEVPVARVAEELPEVVEANLRMILPIAVFCLALLIGCLTLLPRLKVFLH